MTAEPVKRKRGRPRKNPLPEVQEIIQPVEQPRKRGRPRKNPLPAPVAEVPKKAKKDYHVLKFEDIEMWAETADREIFKQAVSDFKKLLKSKVSPEIRWYKDKIVVVPA